MNRVKSPLICALVLATAGACATGESIEATTRSSVEGDASSAPPVDSGLTCGTGTKLCDGRCVRPIPANGCGLVGCTPCSNPPVGAVSICIDDQCATQCTSGACGSGGAPNTGGAPQSGGTPNAGGSVSSGGTPQSGGTPSTGGAPNSGGSVNSGGTVNTGGVATGGVHSGGTVSSGGSGNTGGTPTGGTSSGGAASGGSASGGGSACPNYPTKDSCSLCLCAKCSIQISNCFSSTDQTKNQQCKQIEDCAEQNHCASTPCYCGQSALCIPPNGACRAVIEQVVGSNNLLQVQNASNDANHPLGRANQIGICATNSCRSECQLP